MNVTITIDRRRADPIQGLAALVRRGAVARQQYNAMGEADPSRPGAFEHSEARGRLLREFLTIDDALIGLARVLGPEAAEAAKIPQRIIDRSLQPF